MLSSSFIAILLCGLLQESRSRFVSLSLNFSLGLTDEGPSLPSEEGETSQMAAKIMKICFKETTDSMADLQRYRRLVLFTENSQLFSKLTSDDDAANNETPSGDGDGDGDESPQAILAKADTNDELVYCFAQCLYEQAGILNPYLMEQENFFQNLYAPENDDQKDVPECQNLETENKCEMAYKKHLCYRRLKSLDAEKKIRKILEGGDAAYDGLYFDGDNLVDDGTDDGAVEDYETSNVSYKYPQSNEIGSE